MEVRDPSSTSSSAVHVAPAEGRAMRMAGAQLVTRKVSSDQTGGAYSLFEATTHSGSGPPPHVHHREDEAYYVLEGEYEFMVDDHTIKAGAGSLIYVPKGTLHTHKNVGDGVGRMLLTQTPGGLYELFFQKAGRPADGDDGGPLAFEDLPHAERWIVEVAAEHGTEIPPSLVD